MKPRHIIETLNEFDGMNSKGHYNFLILIRIGIKAIRHCGYGG
jgi:hypothetical protein